MWAAAHCGKRASGANAEPSQPQSPFAGACAAGNGRAVSLGALRARTLGSVPPPRPESAVSPGFLVRTGLVSQAPEWGPAPGGSVRFKRARGGARGGGRKGAPAPGAGASGGGRGAVRGSCVRRGPVFRTFPDVKAPSGPQRYARGGCLRGLSRDSQPGAREGRSHFAAPLAPAGEAGDHGVRLRGLRAAGSGRPRRPGRPPGRGVRAPPWSRNRKGARPPVLGRRPGPEGIQEASAEVRTAPQSPAPAAGAGAGGAGRAESRRRAAGATPAGSVRAARPGVGPARLAPRAPSSSRGAAGQLAGLPHPPRRSSPASRLPTPLSARPAGAGPASPGPDRGGWGVGWRWGAGCLVLLSGGPWVGGARGRGLGLGGEEGAARRGRIWGFVPAGTCGGTCGAEIRSHLSADPLPPMPCAVSSCPQTEAFISLWRREFLLGALDFCVDDRFTIVAQQLCESGQITPSLLRAPEKALCSS